MGQFIDNGLTSAGAALLNDVQMGAVFTPTKIVLGSGYIPSGQTVQSMTAVVTPEVTLDIVKKEKSTSSQCLFICRYRFYVASVLPYDILNGYG